MVNRCKTEILFEELEGTLRRFSHGETVSEKEIRRAEELIEQYWEIACPDSNPCRPNTCSFAKPLDWLAYLGYTSLADSLYHVKNGARAKYFDVLRAEWAKRKGHFNG